MKSKSTKKPNTNNSRKSNKKPLKEEQQKNKFKQIITSVIELFKKNKKRNIIIGIILLIIIAIIIFTASKGTESKYVLNNIYDIYPEEVRNLYTNVVEISCNGDLYLDVKLDAPATKVEDLNKQVLLDYLFSNIDKNDELNENTTKALITSRAKELFYSNVDLLSAINGYQYGDYKYTLNGNKVSRQSSSCQVKDKKYVSFLHGYSYNKNTLSMDVNISYQKGNTLFALDDRPLGEYNGDMSKLFGLTGTTSYYRFNYVKEGNNYKLDSVAWMSRS